jgi:hypothetical protein
MNNKVKFRLKITGFELEMEGTKESTSQITTQVNNTLKGLVSPPSLDESASNNGGKSRTEDSDVIIESSSIKRRTRKSKSQNQFAEPEAIEFVHDGERYGMPSIKWNTATKSIWLLYVVKHIAKKDSISTKQIKATFNKQFKHAKTILNVARDLGHSKLEAPYYVGEDTTKNPHEWYITESGEKYIQKLIADMKLQANGVS